MVTPYHRVVTENTTTVGWLHIPTTSWDSHIHRATTSWNSLSFFIEGTSKYRVVQQDLWSRQKEGCQTAGEYLALSNERVLVCMNPLVYAKVCSWCVRKNVLIIKKQNVNNKLSFENHPEKFDPTEVVRFRGLESRTATLRCPIRKNSSGVM